MSYSVHMPQNHKPYKIPNYFKLYFPPVRWCSENTTGFDNEPDMFLTCDLSFRNGHVVQVSFRYTLFPSIPLIFLQEPTKVYDFIRASKRIVYSLPTKLICWAVALITETYQSGRIELKI